MIFVFLAPGFEESEAICPIDVLKRAELDVVTVSITDDREVVGAHGITVRADVTLSQLPDCHPEAIVLPGGMPGTKNLDACEELKKRIRQADMAGDVLLCAICAAPMILGKMGLLEGKKATCYPGFEQYLEGAIVTGRVRTDGKVITACGMGAAIEFGLAIVEELKGKNTAEKIKEAILAR